MVRTSGWAGKDGNEWVDEKTGIWLTNSEPKSNGTATALCDI